MQERLIRIHEFESNPHRCVEELRNGTTLLLTDGERRIARLIPERRDTSSKSDPAIAWSGRRLKNRKPKVRLRGAGTMADIVKENRR